MWSKHTKFSKKKPFTNRHLRHPFLLSLLRQIIQRNDVRKSLGNVTIPCHTQKFSSCLLRHKGVCKVVLLEMLSNYNVLSLHQVRWCNHRLCVPVTPLCQWRTGALTSGGPKRVVEVEERTVTRRLCLYGQIVPPRNDRSGNGESFPPRSETVIVIL